MDGPVCKVCEGVPVGEASSETEGTGTPGCRWRAQLIPYCDWPIRAKFPNGWGGYCDAEPVSVCSRCGRGYTITNLMYPANGELKSFFIGVGQSGSGSNLLGYNSPRFGGSVSAE